MGASIGASVPLPMKVKRPLHQKKRTSPARSGSNPMSQREGTSRTVSPEDCTSSQGMTPATVPGIKAMKKSDRRTPMKILLRILPLLDISGSEAKCDKCRIYKNGAQLFASRAVFPGIEASNFTLQ